MRRALFTVDLSERGDREFRSVPPLHTAYFQMPDEEGFHLIPYDKSGQDLGDTFHEMLEEAFERGRFSNQVQRDEWSRKG